MPNKLSPSVAFLLLSVAASSLAGPPAYAVSLGVGGSAAVGVGLSGGANAGVSAGVHGGSNASAIVGASGDAGIAFHGSVSGSSSLNASSILGAFALTQAEIDTIATLKDDSIVNVVGIGVVAKADADAFAKVEAANADATAQLQAAINANADFKAQLEENKIDVSTIVAADVAADGALTLFTNG